MVRVTPALLVVFVLVLHRWIEARAGWPEWVTFPLMGLLGTLLIDRLLLPPSARLDRRGWLANAAIAAGAGAALVIAAR